MAGSWSRAHLGKSHEEYRRSYPALAFPLFAHECFVPTFVVNTLLSGKIVPNKKVWTNSSRPFCSIQASRLVVACRTPILPHDEEVTVADITVAVEVGIRVPVRGSRVSSPSGPKSQLVRCCDEVVAVDVAVLQ